MYPHHRHHCCSHIIRTQLRLHETLPPEKHMNAGEIDPIAIPPPQPPSDGQDFAPTSRLALKFRRK